MDYIIVIWGKNPMQVLPIIMENSISMTVDRNGEIPCNEWDILTVQVNTISHIQGLIDILISNQNSPKYDRFLFSVVKPVF